MTVKLAGYSTRLGSGPDESLLDQIAYYARVSNPSSQMSGLNNERLCAYLIKHQHWSPFEMVSVTLDISTSRDVSRQIIRHRSMSYQEFSQRYSATETTCNTRQARMQDTTNRQNSLPADDADLKRWWTDKQLQIMDLTFLAYDQALKHGVAKEVARAILPEGLTLTRLFVTGSIRSWLHYISLRTAAETQLEHRDVARDAAREIARVFPPIMDFYQKEKNDY